MADEIPPILNPEIRYTQVSCFKYCIIASGSKFTGIQYFCVAHFLFRTKLL